MQEVNEVKVFGYFTLMCIKKSNFFNFFVQVLSFKYFLFKAKNLKPVFSSFFEVKFLLREK